MDLSINQQAARELCLEILPLVRRKLPGWEVNVLVAGKNPPEKIVRLGQADKGIRITGTLDDLTACLQAMDIMVLPLREGGGTKLRVLEGMAAGLPVVGTRLALIGLEGIRENENCCPAESAGQMAATIAELALDPRRRREIGRNARNFAIGHYDWDGIVAQLGRDLQSIAEAG
jgi:glycosyltransferase involved in cell wall biosynthesis